MIGFTPEELSALSNSGPSSPTPPPRQDGIMRRIGAGIYNLPKNVAFNLSQMGGGIADTLAGVSPEARALEGQLQQEAKQDFLYGSSQVSAPQTAGQAATDIITQGVLPEIASFLIPSTGIAKGARLLGMGRAAPIVADTITGAASGLRESPTEAGLQAAEFGGGAAVLSSLAKRTPVTRALLGGAANAGIGVTGQLARGNDLTSTEALTQIGVMAGLPMAQEAIGAGTRRLLRPRNTPVKEVDVEVIPPTPEPLALEDRKLMLEGPSAYGQAATDRRFRRVGEAYTPDSGPIAMPMPERPLLNAPREAAPSRPIIEEISPQPERAVPFASSSGEPMQAGGVGLRPLKPRSEAASVNPALLAPIAGAGVGAISDPESPIRGGLIGAAIAMGGAKGARFLRSAKLREAADMQMRPQQSTALGRIGRFMEKNMNLGKSSRLTALDDRAKGEADMYATRMDKAIKAAGRMAYGENLTPAQKTAGEAFLSSKGDPVDLAKMRAAGLPEEYRNYLETAKDSQKQMQGILMRAESDPKRQNMIANSLGEYQTRQYRYFLQPDTFQIDPADKAAVVSEWQKNPLFKDVDPAALQKAVTDDLDQHLRELRDAGGDYTRLGTESKSRISQTLFKSQKDLTANYRKLLGEVSDPHERQVLTANKLVQSVAQAKLIGDLRTATDAQGNRFAMSFKEWSDAVAAAQRAGDTAKADFLSNRYVNAPDSPGMAALAGQKVQRQIADHFQFTGHKGLETGDGGWIAALNQIPKAVFTRFNIGTWVRNFAQSYFQGNALGIFDPSRIPKIAWRLSKDPALREELMRSGVLGAHAGRHEFGKQTQELAASLDKGLKSRMKSVMRVINEGYGLPDQWIRATAYIEQMEKGIAKGLSREEAGLRALEFVNRYSQNYGQVPKIVGRARNVPVVSPFVAYSTEMARILKNLAEDVVTGNDRAMESGIALASLLAMPAMVSYAAKEFNLTPEQKKELAAMEEIMPPYMRGRLNLSLGVDEQGNFSQANLQPWLPAGDYISMARNILRGDGEALMYQNPVASFAGTPVINALVEGYTGKDMVTGQKTSIPEIVAKNVVPMKYRMEQIGRAFTPNEEGDLGITDNAGRQTTPANAIAGLFGFSSSNVSSKRLLRRMEFEIKDEIADAKKDAMKVLRTNAAPEIKEAARREFQQRKQRILLRRAQVLEQFGQ